MMKKGCFLMILLLVAGASWGGYYWYQRANKPPQWVIEKADVGEVRQTVAAAGSLDALTSVVIGSQISGILASVCVDFNDTVKANQLVALIDPSTFQAQVDQALANLENAKADERNGDAQIRNLHAGLANLGADEKVAESNVKKAQAALTEATRNFRRIKDLGARKLVAAAELDTAGTTLDSQSAGVDAANAQLGAIAFKRQALEAQIEAAKAQLEGSQARIRQMEAQLSVARINLGRTRIISPIDGVVIDRKVEVGQTVAASLQAPTLYTIVNDLRKMMINTAVDEADIGGVREGQEVTFTVDAFKGRTFKGKVFQIRLSPTAAQNVVTYPVIVHVDNDDMALKPGMTANVEILVDKRENVVRAPTRALFFKPNASLLPANISIPPADQGTNTANLWLGGRRGFPKPIQVKTGLANNQFTEIISDQISSGTQLVVAQKTDDGSKGQNGASPQGGGGGGGGGGRMRVRMH